MICPHTGRGNHNIYAYFQDFNDPNNDPLSRLTDLHLELEMWGRLKRPNFNISNSPLVGNGITALGKIEQTIF